MKTLWTEQAEREIPLPEYPRPQLVRLRWLNLNGLWNYAVTEGPGCPRCFDGRIRVPFSPETELSGVGHSLTREEYLWYRREVEIPTDFLGKRLLLHFGAVDQEAWVWVNDIPVAHHVGGYLPFSAEITEAVRESRACITVRVTDNSDHGYHSRGKQSSKRGGIWYTPQSGIWQTVWLEPVPERYVKNLHITPDFDGSCVEVTAETVGEGEALALFGGESYPLPAHIPVPDFEAWSPEHPRLYDFSVCFGDDRVESYFAMRKFSIEKDEKNVPRLFLNGKPYFHNGLLDQGYWPDGLYTAPSDEALIYDIEMAKAMGFNMLRKHIKVEPLRWYYHCDRLGMLVWQDMPNGGGRYDPLVITTPLVTGRHFSDRFYALFARGSREGREQYRRELSEMVQHLYNCPCIAMWVPFNEGWGQFDAAEAYRQIRELDATRSIDHASGWHDQKIGQTKSLHVYFKKYSFRPDPLGRAVMLTEFGGYNYRVPGHCFNEKDFGYKRFSSPEELEKALEELYRRQIAPAKEQGLCAAVYTQLSDVEDELNGLLSYDRQVCKLSQETVRKIVGAEHV